MKTFILYLATTHNFKNNFVEIDPRPINAESIEDLVKFLKFSYAMSSYFSAKRYFLVPHSRAQILDIYEDVDLELFDDNAHFHLGAREV